MSKDRKYKGETWTGRTYWEDEEGDREYEDETWTGRKYREDSDGNRTYEGETWTGRKYREDSDGNRTYEDEIEKGETWTGREYEEKKSGCFLTTACVLHAGLSDDCLELQQLRSFRDSYVVNLPNGRSILKRYYSEAPTILERIMKSSEKQSVLSDIFKTIQRAVYFIKAGENKRAFECYENMYRSLSIKFNKKG